VSQGFGGGINDWARRYIWTKHIKAELQNLEKAIKANIRRASEENRKSPKEMRIKNLQDMIVRLEKMKP
jgi:hypothetical protein